jgi:autophagy-related protein 2
MRLRGVVMIMLPAALPGTEPHPMTDFFSRPLIPPKLPQSYLRVHLENMSASMLSRPSNPSDGDAFTFTLGDVSAFVFHQPSTEDSGLSASPLLITDHHLCTQYSPPHIHPGSPDDHDDAPLPTFEVIDWTDPKHKSVGMKVSHWRTKVKPKSNKLRRDSRIEAASSPLDPAATASQLPPAIAVAAKRSIPKHRSPISTAVEVVVEPLHVFLDLDLASSGFLAFLDELVDQVESPTPPSIHDDYASEDSDEETPPASPQARRSVKEQERERRRLEKMVLEDLDLDLDYRPNKNRPPKRSKVSSFKI